MSDYIVPELQKYIVTPKELSWPEYEFRIKWDFSIKIKKNTLLNNLKKIITGLLNTSGGIITIENGSPQTASATVVDEWRTAFPQQLTGFMKRDICMNYVHVVGYELPLQIVVMKSHELVTLNSHCYTRHCAATVGLYEATPMSGVINNCTSSQPRDPLQFVQIKLNESVNVLEEDDIEFKYWTVRVAEEIREIRHGKVETLLMKLAQSNTFKTVLAMGNLPRGGTMFLGIKDPQNADHPKAIGYVLSDLEREALVEGIDQLMKSDPDTKAQRIWGLGVISEEDINKLYSEEGNHTIGVSPSRGTHWNVTFVEVQNCPQEEQSVLVKITIPHCKGGLFEAAPESYFIHTHGNVCHMAPSEWRRRIITLKSTVASVTVANKLDAAQDQPDNPSEPGAGASGGSESFDKAMEVDDVLQKMVHVSWAEHGELQKYLFNSTTNHKHCMVSDIAKECTIFEMKSPLNFVIKEEVLLSTCSSEQSKANLQGLLNEIRVSAIENKGFAIASKTWMLHIQEDRTVSVPPHHTMDILSVHQKSDDKCQLQFFVICSEAENRFQSQEQLCYMRQVSRLLKRFIVMESSNVYISCKLLHLYRDKNNISQKDPEIDQLSEKNSQMEKHFHSIAIKNLTESLAKLFSSTKHLSIKSAIGESIMINLTKHQATIICKPDQLNFIDAPPGSGKTILALYIAQKFGASKCKFLTGSPGARAYAEYQGLIDPLYINEPGQLRSMLEQGLLNGYNCIIFDDIQNTELASDEWTELYQYIAESEGCTLYLFGDNSCQNYKGNTAARETLCEFGKKHSFNMSSMADVHRNSRIIFSYLKATDQEKNMTEVQCVHGEDGDDVDIRSIPNMWMHSVNNGLINVVRKLVDPLAKLNGHAVKFDYYDITILLSSHDLDKTELLRDMLRKYLPESQVQDALTFPVRGIRVDTVDNFIGLDSKVCILAYGHTQLQQTRNHLLLNNKFQALIASRAIYRMIFAIDDTITGSFVDKMHFENVRVNRTPQPSCPSNSVQMSGFAVWCGLA